MQDFNQIALLKLMEQLDKTNKGEEVNTQELLRGEMQYR